MNDDQISKIAAEWARSRFDLIISHDDLELVEDAFRWAVDFGRLDPGTGLLSSVEEAT